MSTQHINDRLGPGGLNEVVTTYTDPSTGQTVLVGADGAVYAAMPLVGGNVVANVNLRTGLFSSLIDLSGGASEVSRPSDVDVLILHNGNPNQAKTIYRTGQIGTIASFTVGSNTGATAIPTGTDGGALLVAATAADRLDTFGNAISAGLDVFTVPSSPSRPAFVSIELAVKFGASAVGTVRSITLQRDLDGLGSWSNVSTTANITATAVSASQVLRGTLAGKISITDGEVGNFRLLCKQDSGADMTVNLQFMEARIYRFDR